MEFNSLKILNAREERINFIESLIVKDKVIISIRANYPGCVKDNVITRNIVNNIINDYEDSFNFLEKYSFNNGEGLVYVYILNSIDVVSIKKNMIKIEEKHPLGRLVDIDVYYRDIKSISRKELGYKERKCFLCDDNAYNCIRSKNHTIESVLSYINKTVEDYERNQLALKMVELSNQAMLYELFTYPSFGNVSPYSKGSHKDMDYYTFIDSISVLNKYMYEIAYTSYNHKSIEEIYDDVVEIGIKCEKEMFKKTNGINTHKGLIFVLGSIISATMITIYRKQSFDEIFNNIKVLLSRKLIELDDLSLINKDNLSNGEKIYIKHKIKGVRKEGSLGFPIIRDALNLLDINDKLSFVKTFIYIISKCEDTTIIHRRGVECLDRVKNIMNDLYLSGYNDKKLLKVEKEFIDEGINPGGSADLLCGTIFLSLVKKENNFRRE